MDDLRDVQGAAGEAVIVSLIETIDRFALDLGTRGLTRFAFGPIVSDAVAWGRFALMKDFDESQHPRVPAGSPEGGEFGPGAASEAAEAKLADEPKAGIAAAAPPTVSRLTRPRVKAVAPHGLPALARKAATHEPAAERFWFGLLQDLRATGSLDGLEHADGWDASPDRKGVLAVATAAVKDWAKGLQTQVEDVLEPVFLEGTAHGAVAAGVTIAARKTGQDKPSGPISFTLINQRAIDWATAHATELIDDLSQTSLDGIKQLVEEALGGKWTTAQVARLLRTVIGLRADQVTAVARERERLIERGLPEATVDARVGRYAQGQLRQRAKLIARTEIIRASGRGQQEIWDIALEKGYLKAGETFKTWEIAEDEITCFLGLTLIDTPDGARRIDALHAGDIVLTHLGPRPVKAVIVNQTRSTIVRVATEGGESFATADHPFLIVRNGRAEWCLAGSLLWTDSLLRLECPLDRRAGADVVNLSLSDPYDAPTMLRQPRGALNGCRGLVSVPIVAIDFQRDPLLSDQEVDAVTTERRFLNELNSTTFEFFPNGSLDGCLTLIAPIADEGAENSRGSWSAPKGLPAGSALSDDRRSSAEFRAELSASVVVVEPNAATRTVFRGHDAQAAFARTHGVAVSDTLWYGERLRADRADFLDHRDRFRGAVAGPGTEASLLAHAGVVRRSKDDPALDAGHLAVNERCDSIAGDGTVFRVCPPDVTFGPLSRKQWDITDEAFDRHRSIVTPHVVYSLEIVDARTFFAGGVLVHNCNACRDLSEDDPVPVDEPFSNGEMSPPDHPACRCSASLEFVKAGEVAAGYAPRAKAAHDVSDEPRDERGRWTTGGAGFADRRAALGIPPAWTDVRIATDQKADLQATGTDAKGRTQYLYSAAHSERAAAEKFARLKDFNKDLPRLRKVIDADLKDKALDPAAREAAAALKLVEATGFRIGSDQETGGAVQAFGASTLRAEHVSIDGATVTFAFVGKHGVAIEKTVTDAALAKELRPRVAAGGRLFDTTDSDVRDYLHARDGHFKVKDFRTWHGTTEALKAVRDMPVPRTKTEYAKAQRAVGDRVAAHLGNTRAVALSSYIDPAVWSPWKTASLKTTR